MQSFLVSTGVVALAEMGDKTQLLAFILAARFRKPLPIVAGILAATLVNHGLAGALGAWITSAADPGVLRWVLGLSFLAMAGWTLIPDEIEKDEAKVAQRLGVFGATLVTFFLAEMGDKTQIATVAMAAHYESTVLVVLGTTLGMLIADVPAVFVGERFAKRIPMRAVHLVAAAIFALMGAATLFGGMAYAQTAKEKKTIAAHAKKLDFWQLCGEAGRALRNPSRTAKGKYWQRIVLDRANIPADDHRYIRERRLRLGMDECSVVAIFGKPDALNADGGARGRELVYRERGVSVYTDNGVVRAWEE